MQNQLQWRQHSFNPPKQSAFGISAPNENVAASPSAGLNASAPGSSTAYLNGRIFASTAATSSSTLTSTPVSHNAQQKSGPTVVRHEDSDGVNDGSHAPSNAPSNISSIGSRANASSISSVPLSTEHGPNKENAARAGPKPVLKMKRTGQNLPISSEIYQRTKSPSTRQSSGPILPSNLNHTNKKPPVAPVSLTTVNAPADRKHQIQTVGPAISTDLPKPVVGDVRKGPRAALSKPAESISQQRENLRALPASSVSDSDSESGEDSDGAIKYEKVRPAGVDYAEGGASDRETSDGESGSESDGDETVDMLPKTQKSSFQQLFQPPDLDTGSDDEADCSSEDDDDASTSRSSSPESEADENSAVALPIGGALYQVSYPSTVLTLANAKRPYTQFIDRGANIKAAPAIFPDGYKKCAEFKAIGNEWICAIRSCRQCYKSSSGLSRHARFAHIRTLLNDNMDGTLSIVGTYTQKDPLGRSCPLVVSRRPLDPNEPPMVNPSLYKKDRKGEKLLDKIGSDSTHIHTKRVRRRLPRGETESNPPTKPSLSLGKAAAEPDPRSRLLSSSEIKPIEMATKDRPYKLIEGLNGSLQPTCGALLPRKYERDTTIPGHPWICPIRSCRCVFSKIVSLGSHFVRQHWTKLLNDNLDGTLSEIGNYQAPLPGKTSLPAVVISQKPIDPSEGPPAEPRLPAQWKGDKIPSTPGAVLSSQDGSASATATATASRERVSKFWDYLLPYLPEGLTEVPTSPEIVQPLELPRKRMVAWRDNLIKRRLDTDSHQLLGIIVHLVGDQQKTVSLDSREMACTNCMNSLGPFKGCQILPGRLSTLAHDCCANCLFGHNRETCSIKVSSRLKDAVLGGDEAAGTQRKRQLSDPEAVDGGSGVTARRSERLQSLEENAGMEPKRKNVRLSLNSGQNKMGSGRTESATANKATSSSNTRQLVTASSSSSILQAGQVEPNHFEMESWEIAPGHIEETSAERPNNIFFSKPYLEQRQAVQISPDLHVRVETIKSGHTSEIEAHAKNTRYCYVASGKVWVNIEGELETALGTHGMFKIMPGKKARVQNRLYFDSVMQVSTFASW